MALASGTKLGPYEITAALGAGGMGEVYRARDTRLERAVAIKILPAQFSADTVCKQRFEREAKTISQLNHPHICTLYDVGSQDGIGSKPSNYAFLLGFLVLGWETGIEPATSGATDRRSTS
jgi:eukaryotic-like serine/threonine-protein kinase